MSQHNKNLDLKETPEIIKILDSIIENQKEHINNLENISYNIRKELFEYNNTPDFSNEPIDYRDIK